MGKLLNPLIVSLCLVINSYSQLGRSSHHRQSKPTPNLEIETANRQIIQAAAAKSLSEINDATTGRVKLSIKLRGGQPVLTSSFSPNERQLLVAQGVAAFLYDLKDGVELRVFRHSGIVTSAEFSPDGRLLATGSTDKTARLWNVRSGREIRRFNGHPDAVTSVEFSPDGRWLVTGCSDQTARLWDVGTGALIKAFRNAEEKEGSEQEQSQDEDELQQGEEGYEEAVASMFSYKTFSAVFSKKGSQVITGDADQHVKIWSRLSGRLTKQLDEGIGFEWGVRRVMVSPDDRHLITLSEVGAQMWIIETGEEEKLFKANEGDDEATAAAFSPDGRFVLAGYAANKVRLLNSKTGEVVKEYKIPAGPVTAVENAAAGDTKGGDAVTTVGFTRDGRGVVAGSTDGRLAEWETETGKLTQSFEGNLMPVESLDVSNDGRYLLIGSDRNASLWDLGRGSLTRHLEGHSYPISSVKLSPDSTLALTVSNRDQNARLWKVRDGSLVEGFAKPGNQASTGAFSPDGKFLLLGQNAAPLLWDVENATRSRSFARNTSDGVRLNLVEAIVGQITSVAFSGDGRYALTGGENETAMVWETSTGKPLIVFKGHQERKHQEIVRNLQRTEVLNSVLSVALSNDGRTSLTASRDNTARLWESKSGKELQLFAGHAGDVSSVQFSPDGRKVLTTSADATAVLWDLETGSVERVFAGHRATVTSAAFLAGGKFILTGSQDGTARLWETSTGHELCSLITFRDGSWVVVAPDGRFDTNNLEAIRGLNWIAPDDPYHPLPLEIFVRDYYEPRLFPRLLNGDKFRSIRPLVSLNRAQPIVKITKIEQHKQQPDLVSVTLVASSGQFKPQQRGLLKSSGVYDLRLFREGQLVGYEPRSSVNTRAYSSLGAEVSFEQELGVWREISKFTPDPMSGNSKIFTVTLPKDRDLSEVEFSAYAFNDDRVKSETYRTVYKLPQPLKASAKGRAYVITIGVAASEDPRWNLFYPANDAREMQKSLYDVLSRQREVVRVPLVSDFGGIAGKAGNCPEMKPTKNAIKTVLDLLAGRNVGPGHRKLVPCAEQIQKASPDDFVLISFSSHGFSDGRGNYFIFPYDTGKTKADPVFVDKIGDGLLQRLISSEELSAWMRDIDAGQIVMILDACQSEAATGNEFKPGPMGSRGLGQLAYDKGMRLIVATQADNQAVGVGSLKNGLLTYALTTLAREGAQAKKLTIKEWLEQAAENVPKLFEDKVPPEVKKQARLQQPSVFDFARSTTPVVLIRND